MTKPVLKYSTKCYQNVDYADLEQFVQALTGREWSFVAAGEYGNDEDHSFTTDAKPLSERDAAEMRRFVETGAGYPHPSTMISWLAAEEHIGAGNWNVSIFW